MNPYKLDFKIDADGYLLVSYDGGCTYEIVGEVKGAASTVEGPQGLEGPQGPSGQDGADGKDGDTPFIDEVTGTWWIGNFDTGVKAEGVNGDIDIESSLDLGVVGTPSITKRQVENTLLLQFHELKGEKGDSPVITAIRDTEANTVTLYIDGVEAATLFDGIQYTVGEGVDIDPLSNAISIKYATDSAIGGVKLGTSTIIDSTAAKTYPIGFNSDSKLFVDVPWSNTASLQIGNTSDKKINTSENANKFVQFTGGTGKFTVSDGTNSFDVPVGSGANDGKLSIKGGNTTVTEFTANQSTNKSVSIIGDIGITVQGNSSTGQIVVSTESCHTVTSKTGILNSPSEHGSQAYELGIVCDLSGVTVKAVDLMDFAVNTYETTCIYKFVKGANESDKYAGIFGVTSADGCFVFKVTLENTVTGETESHLYGVIADPPDNSTFLFVTTNSWPIVCKYSGSSLYSYLKIPDDFVGNIIVTPMRYNFKSGSFVFCFEPNSPLPQGRSWGGEYEEITYNLYSESNLFGSDLTPSHTPSGRYKVDVLGDFGGDIAVGDKVSDNIINDYLLHTLSKKVDSLITNNSLTIGQTTITEAQLQALLALLQGS